MLFVSYPDCIAFPYSDLTVSKKKVTFTISTVHFTEYSYSTFGLFNAARLLTRKLACHMQNALVLLRRLALLT